MNNVIVFLGTGGDPIVVGKQVRASGGIMLLIDGNQFILDPGPGALIRAKQYDVNLRETIAVFVSHNHILHCNDINAVISAMTYGGMDSHGVIIADEATLQGNEEEKPYITRYHKNLLEKAIVMKPGTKIGVNNINIYGTRTTHCPGSVGFQFCHERYKVSYTGDTEYSEDLAEDHKGSSILIINCRNPFSIQEKGYLNSDDAVALVKKVKPKLAIITHFGIKMIEADPLVEAREIHKQTGVQIIAAKDGLAVNPTSYSSSTRHKTLESFSK